MANEGRVCGRGRKSSLVLEEAAFAVTLLSQTTDVFASGKKV